MTDFATINDITDLKRKLSADEQTRASKLIPLVCNIIRAEGKAVNKDVDALCISNPEYAYIVKSIVIGVVLRELDTPAGQLPVTQQTESAGGLSLSYSIPNASEAIRLWPSDLKALGFKRQRIKMIDLWGSDDE